MLVKEVYRPGVYQKGGKLINITPNDVADSFAMLAKLNSVNLDVPIILEHVPPKPDQTEGVPMALSDAKADELRRTVGRVVFNHKGTRINESGALEAALTFSDPEIEQKVKAGDIKFVSPEIRQFWRDGKGNEYRNVPTHIALTHRPIQIDQRPGFEYVEDAPQDAQTLALSDAATPDSPLYLCFESDAIQLADDGTNGETHPDKPKESGQKFDALLAQLAKMGLCLPSDTDPENLVDRLLTAAMTLNDAADKMEREEARNPDSPQGGGAVEMSPKQYQFSDANSPQAKLCDRIRRCVAQRQMDRETADELLIRVGATQFSDDGSEKVAGGLSIADVIAIHEKRETNQFADGSPQDAIVKRIKRLAEAGNITPGIRDQLLSRVGALQFSDDGSEQCQGGVPMTTILDTYERGGNLMQALLGEKSTGYGQFSSDELQHPGGTSWSTGNKSLQVGDPSAQSIAKGLLDRTGFARKPTAADVETAARR